MAAIDLGSNSFHLVVAHARDGRLELVDRLRQRVALAEGLNSEGQLDATSRTRALDCLQQFANRVRGLPADRCRIVATNTFRKIKDQGQFMRAATAALTRPIEIISGTEEANLVFLGIRYDVGATTQPLLAIDVGGGSTEIAWGRGDVPTMSESVQVGCVTLSQRHFADGKISKKRFMAATLDAAIELEPIAHRFATQASDVFASSGTALAIEQIGREHDWCDEGINRTVLKRLRKKLIEAGHIDSLELPGLTDSRRPVIAGGVAAMTALFDAIKLDHIRTSRGALREGVLIDMMGRFTGSDRRDQSVELLAKRCMVDAHQVDRVRNAALLLLRAVEGPWELDQRDAQMLQWAVQLHEIGLSISHTDYHRHGEYLVAHSDLPGFSRTTQETLAAIVRLHRKRISENRLPDADPHTRARIRDLALILRVAVHLHRTRTDDAISHLQALGSPQGLTLMIPSREADMHPLTMADLQREADAWTRMGRTLTLGNVD